MDLNEILKTFSPSRHMDAHNVTATVLNLIAQFGKKSKRLPKSELLPNGTEIYLASNKFIDEPAHILAHNLTTILYNYFQNNTSLLEVLTNNLKNEEIRWREEANRRVSDITFTVIAVAYVSFLSRKLYFTYRFHFQFLYNGFQ